MYTKDHDTWNGVKKKIDQKERVVYAHPREVWWCSLGVNVGTEVDGKNHTFERPVLVLKVYNKQSMLVLPITSKEKNDMYHVSVSIQNNTASEKTLATVYIKLTQSRVISNKRLLRKVDVIAKDDFAQILEAYKNHL